jgi:hypothetical protein
MKTKLLILLLGGLTLGSFTKGCNKNSKIEKPDIENKK